MRASRRLSESLAVPRSGSRLAFPRVLRQSVRDLWSAQAMEWAAALSCYAFLSGFPLLLAVAAAASHAVAPAVVAARFSAVAEGFLPPDVVDLDPVVAAAVAAPARMGVFAILAWLLSGRRIFGALVTALDRVSDVDAREETVERRALVELALLAGVTVLFAAALVARPVLGALWDAVWGSGSGSPVGWLVGAAAHVLLLVAAFYALYAVVPRGERENRAALTGAVAAAMLVLVARAAFAAALDPLWTGFALAYGPLALAALLLSWGWVLGLIVLFGASLASHVKVMVIEGRSAREAEQRHVARKDAA
jgi:YihY family inner membrane protein